MSWQRMWFKKNKAYIRVDETGKPVLENGRAEMKYKPEDGRSYRVSPENIRSLDGPPPRASATTAKRTFESPKKRRPSPAQGRESLPPTDPEATAASGGQAVEIWTDGACSGNPGDAGAGVVIVYGRHRLELSRYLGTATNNIAELTAIELALSCLKSRNKPIRLHTDSSYSIGVLQKGWKAKKNPELVERIRTLMSGFARLKLVKVAGHAGVPENERADELARLAVSTRSDSETRQED